MAPLENGAKTDPRRPLATRVPTHRREKFLQETGQRPRLGLETQGPSYGWHDVTHLHSHHRLLQTSFEILGDMVGSYKTRPPPVLVFLRTLHSLPFPLPSAESLPTSSPSVSVCPGVPLYVSTSLCVPLSLLISLFDSLCLFICVLISLRFLLSLSLSVPLRLCVCVSLRQLEGCRTPDSRHWRWVVF